MSIPDFDNITLSNDQAKAFNRLKEFVENPIDAFGGEDKERFITLKGHAGTGKTLLITMLVHELGRRYSFALTAPTNKATKVLDKMAWESEAPVSDVRTIYSLLGLKLMATGEVKELQGGGKSGNAQDFNVIVIDEASMINKELFGHIIRNVPGWVKVIFVGDPLQLPPVNEDGSMVFSEDLCEILLLEQVVRQAEDSPIISLAQDLRERILSGDRSNLNIQTVRKEKGGVFVLPPGKFKAWMKAGFKSQTYAKDGDSFRTVAWRNVVVDDYNQYIRRSIYGEYFQDPFMIGEKVLAAEPVQAYDETMTLEDNAEIVMKTDEEGFVIDVSEMIHPYVPKQYGDFKVYRIELGGTETGAIETFLIHPDSERDFKRKLNDLSDRARKERRLWRSFWAFKERFHDIRPAHALTSHRSQGSTYQVCFVDVRDIFANRNVVESLKSLYVACTRASETLCLTGL